MTTTAHTLVAGLIATEVANPAHAALLGFVSHFVLDSIPHWDFGTNWRRRPKWNTGMLAISETIFGVLFSYSIFYQQAPTVTLVVTMLASILPDWFEAPWYIFFAHAKKNAPGVHASFQERFFFRLYKTQNIFHTKTTFPFGIITQIAVVAFFFLLLR
ncbi:hypothetical protein KKB64_01590 [Patescibacteria group bacterium]|nr:hypothetical protein [Patescibacteria group bacterium]MBU1472464.1 hypothetical protein [Patescibacteria group bacterium]MBU2460278.1 hypothetical protein [Patescibacteria group bacterium]MBU2544605.1 hypothetical protein [Patescibacteria group bacterium]